LVRASAASVTSTLNTRPVLPALISRTACKSSSPMLRLASRSMSWASVSLFFIDELLFQLFEQITPNIAPACRRLRHRPLEALLLRTSLRDLIPRIRMPHHACARVVPQHPGDALVGGFGAVADDDDAAVLGVAHPYPAAVVQADPGGAAGDVEHGVEQGPVADGVAAVAH